MIKSFHKQIDLAYTGLIILAGGISLCLQWLELSKHQLQMHDQQYGGFSSSHTQTIDGLGKELVFQTMTETACVLLLILLIGLSIFAMIMRRFDALLHKVSNFDELKLFGDIQTDVQTAQKADQIDQLSEILNRLTDLVMSQNQCIQGQELQCRQLVVNVSHDLRTPLTSMQGYLETLLYKSGKLSDADQHRYLEVAVRQCRRAGRLVQNLFELAKLEAEETQVNFEVFPLQELIQDILEQFKTDISLPSVKIFTKFKPDILPVFADIGMIERVLTILIDNAIRYTPVTGSVWIELDYSDASVMVLVKNTGICIAEEHLSTLFERKSPLRLAPGKNQNGLGLLIANKVIQLHGSKIQVASALDSGTSFYFNLSPAKNADYQYS